MRWDRDKLDTLVAEGWLRSQRHPEADLWIYNYTERTQYEDHWTPETLACRGLIVDAEGATVARPFPKFFNYGTPQAGLLPNEPYNVTEKIDGSLGIYYEIEGEPFIATRGSFTSDQAREGTAMLRDHDLQPEPGTTPVFEIVYPENRIVVDYGGRRDLFLLSAIRHDDATDAPRPPYTGPVVQHYGQVEVHTLAERAKPNREGFVVTFESGHRVKVKFEEYVRLHRIVTGINTRAVWDAMRNGDEIDLEGIPDEIYAWVRATENEIEENYTAIESRAMEVFEARPEADRKETAAYFLASGANPSVLFAMLDGKDYSQIIWREVRPESAQTPDTVWSAAA